MKLLKKILTASAVLLCSLSVTSLSAQSTFGLKAGAGIYGFPSKGSKAISNISLNFGGVYTQAFSQESKVQPLLQLEAAISSKGGEAYAPMTMLQNESNYVTFRGTFLDIPISTGVRINLKNESALSLRTGLYVNMGLCGRKMVVTHLSNEPIFTDMFESKFFSTNDPSQNDQIQSMNRLQGGYLLAVDYSVNKHFVCSLEAQNTLFPKKGLFPSDGNMKSLNLSFSIGYNF